MPVGPFAHVALLVKDLDQAIDDWKKILEVVDPTQVAEPVVRVDIENAPHPGWRVVALCADNARADRALADVTAAAPLLQRFGRAVVRGEVSLEIGDTRAAVRNRAGHDERGQKRLKCHRPPPACPWPPARGGESRRGLHRRPPAP